MNLEIHIKEESDEKGTFGGALEGVEEQCQLIYKVISGHIEFFLNSTLEHLEQGPSNADNEIIAFAAEIERNFISGNETFFLQTLNELDVEAENEEMAESVHEDVFRVRNRIMGGKIIDLIRGNKGHQHYFFALTVGHFLGDDENIVDLVRKAGFKVNRILSSMENGGISAINDVFMFLILTFVSSFLLKYICSL